MDWGEQTTGLDKLQTDLTQSWEYLRAIAKHETSTDTTSMEKKMKCAQSLTEAAQKLKVSKTATPTFHYITLLIISLSVCVCVWQVLQVVHRRVVNRYIKLCLYMGMNSSQVESTRVRTLYAPPTDDVILHHHGTYLRLTPFVCCCLILLSSIGRPLEKSWQRTRGRNRRRTATRRRENSL